MFEDKLEWALCTRGLTVDAFLSLLRDEPYLSDNKIFAISRFINNSKVPVFLTKKIGDIEIVCRRFEVAVTYTIKSTNQCRIDVDFNTLGLEVKYTDRTLIIDQNLMDYRGEHNLLFDLRQEILNEMMSRYFSRVLYAMYRELGWFT